MAKKIIQLVQAQADWFAVYAILEPTEENAPRYSREVIACWGLVEGDENGPCPLVVNDKGYLEPAQDLEGFLGISRPTDMQRRTNWQEIAVQFLMDNAKKKKAK